jgi:hypothetical protein
MFKFIELIDDSKTDKTYLIHTLKPTRDCSNLKKYIQLQ